MIGGEMKGYYVFSPFLRVFHWIMVLAITVLFVTGLYIGNPAYIGTQGIEPTFAVDRMLSMENVRFIHFIAAYVLIASLIFRLYGFCRYKGDRLLPKFWTKLFWQGLIDTQKHYMFLQGAHRPYLRNSLARMGYAGVYMMIAIEGLTGFAMYAMTHPNSWSAKLFGQVNHIALDEYVVHLIHHYVAWAIALFVIIHVYMAARADIKEQGGEISGMISGVKYYEEEPDDLGDIR